MKKLIALACLGVAFAVSSPVFAGEQQEKMKDCNKDAKERGLKGEERKKFMKVCLSSDAEKEKISQQQRMKDCNRDAKERALKGEERKKFMSVCLKK